MAVIPGTRQAVKGDGYESDTEQQMASNAEEEDDEEEEEDEPEETPKKKKKGKKPKVRDLVAAQREDMEVSVYHLNPAQSKSLMLFDQVCEVEPLTTCVRLLS